MPLDLAELSRDAARYRRIDGLLGRTVDALAAIVGALCVATGLGVTIWLSGAVDFGSSGDPLATALVVASSVVLVVLFGPVLELSRRRGGAFGPAALAAVMVLALAMLPAALDERVDGDFVLPRTWLAVTGTLVFAGFVFHARRALDERERIRLQIALWPSALDVDAAARERVSQLARSLLSITRTSGLIAPAEVAGLPAWTIGGLHRTAAAGRSRRTDPVARRHTTAVLVDIAAESADTDSAKLLNEPDVARQLAELLNVDVELSNDGLAVYRDGVVPDKATLDAMHAVAAHVVERLRVSTKHRS